MECIVSNRAREYGARKYQETLPLLKERAGVISDFLDRLTGDERALMEFLYGTMPICDAADYEPELMYAYVKHALFLRREMAWTKALPEDVFLNYVLYYRVNNEAIKDCRKWFYDMLLPVISGCNTETAVKEVNYWCASQATYTLADERTLGPVGVFYSGSGRCGEESTFLVTALRSVGIAARQVYTPRWAHCDDNHAWVEAWIDGSWKFLGACEPEEVMNKGWFTNASSRAMMIHTRVFSDYDSGEGHREELTERDGAALFLNDTHTYAKTGTLTVTVKEADGTPVCGARIAFALLNAAEYYPISMLYTDQEGKAALTLGLGSIRLHVTKGSCRRELMVMITGDTQAEVVLSEEGWQQELGSLKEDWQFIDHTAPRDYPMHPVKLTREQKEINRSRKQEAEQHRLEKLEGYWQDSCHPDDPKAREIIKLSYGNAPEICRFLEAHPKPEALALLSVLTSKDYRDIQAALLEEHLAYGKKVRDFSLRTYLDGAKNADELFLQYVWNPRIRFEEITPYRSYLTNALSEGQKEEFRKDPERVWSWIQETVGYEEPRTYHPVISSPAGVHQTCQGSLLSRKTLFVAICRTLGIPARLNPVTYEAEFYKEHTFHCVSLSKTGEAQVRLILNNPEHPAYFADWTIGRLASDPEEAPCNFKSLDLMGREFENGSLTLLIPEGIYQLITAVRLPSGNQMEARRVLDTADFIPGADGVPECTLDLLLRKPEISQMLESLALEDFTLHREDGSEADARELMEHHTLLAFLEEGAEPTEHFLNELREQEKEMAQSGLKLLFVVTGPDALHNPTLADTRSRLNAEVYYDDFTELPEIMARRMYTDPEKLPLVLLISPGMKGRYASSGYNVGSVAMLLRIAKLLEN